jgi:hypothetical protein
MNIDTQTPEQIAKHYSACLDGVALINAGQPEDMTAEDWADCLARNKEHLVIMLQKPWWTTQDLTAIRAASA